MTRSISHREFEALDMLARTTRAIEAFNLMLTAAVQEGEDFSFVASGVHILLDTQCDHLKSVEVEVRELLAEKRKVDALDANDPRELRKDFIASKINDGVDAGAIANALNLKRETVEKVIRQLQASTDSSAISNSSSDQRSAHG